MVPGDGEDLTLEVLPRIAPALAARLVELGEHAPADLTAANLWLFRRAHGYRFHAGEWPVVSGRSYDGRPHAIPLFDPMTAPAAAVDGLLGRFGSLFPLTKREADALARKGYAITSNRDDSDYVYTAETFASYPGRSLQYKRTLLQRFVSRHDVRVQVYSSALEAEAMAVLDGWMRDKGKSPGEADDLPCREALAHAVELGLKGFVVEANGESAGFLLAEHLQPGVWVIRFAKGLAKFDGVAQFLFQHFAKHPPGRCEWMNFEQDLGLANFRRTKESYGPDVMVPKWRVGPLASGR
jgi:hypothetical protein